MVKQLGCPSRRSTGSTSSGISLPRLSLLLSLSLFSICLLYYCIAYLPLSLYYHTCRFWWLNWSTTQTYIKTRPEQAVNVLARFRGVCQRSSLSTWIWTGLSTNKSLQSLILCFPTAHITAGINQRDRWSIHSVGIASFSGGYSLFADYNLDKDSIKHFEASNSSRHILSL